MAITDKLEWVDISEEKYREYLYPDGEVIRIDAPVAISFSERGHRIYNKAGQSYYIPKIFLAIRWVGWEEGEATYKW